MEKNTDYRLATFLNFILVFSTSNITPALDKQRMLLLGLAIQWRILLVDNDDDECIRHVVKR